MTLQPENCKVVGGKCEHEKTENRQTERSPEAPTGKPVRQVSQPDPPRGFSVSGGIMQFLKVKNWTKFQHFKDRKPPWIKLYRDILDDIEWHELDPKAAKTLVMIWLIASEDSGHVPTGKELAFRLRTTEKEINSIIPRLSHWIIQSDIITISERYQDDPLETETETETETEGEAKHKHIFPFLGQFQNVKLTQEEHQKLKERFGESKTQKRIEALSEYISSKGKKYNSHYATILSWARRDGDYGKQGDDRGHDNVFLRPVQQKAGPSAG